MNSQTMNVANPINSTDATQHAPLAVRARLRRAELAQALEQLPPDEKRVRGDIELALATVDGLLTGDPEHPTDATAAEMNTWLEHTKHVAEAPGQVAAAPAAAPALLVLLTADADAPKA